MQVTLIVTLVYSWHKGLPWGCTVRRLKCTTVRRESDWSFAHPSLCDRWNSPAVAVMSWPLDQCFLSGLTSTLALQTGAHVHKCSLTCPHSNSDPHVCPEETCHAFHTSISARRHLLLIPSICPKSEGFSDFSYNLTSNGMEVTCSFSSLSLI